MKEGVSSSERCPNNHDREPVIGLTGLENSKAPRGWGHDRATAQIAADDMNGGQVGQVVQTDQPQVGQDSQPS